MLRYIFLIINKKCSKTEIKLKQYKYKLNLKFIHIYVII